MLFFCKKGLCIFWLVKPIADSRWVQFRIIFTVQGAVVLAELRHKLHGEVICRHPICLQRMLATRQRLEPARQVPGFHHAKGLLHEVLCVRHAGRNRGARPLVGLYRGCGARIVKRPPVTAEA
jgi:hypothetical protein